MKKKRNKKKKLLLVFLIILIIVAILFLLIRNYVAAKNKEETSFVIDSGMYAKDVFYSLEEKEIINNADISYLYARLLLSDSLEFKAGPFNIPSNLSLKELCEYLCDENNFNRETVTILFKEDDFINDFAKKISDATSLEYMDILAYWSNSDVVKEYMNDYPFLTDEIFDKNIKIILEGYLFPSTYEFYKDASLDEVTRKFLDKTLEIYKKYENDFNNAPNFYHYYDGEIKNASIHEIFTLASMLQWESGNEDDMYDIASVFYNRLNAPEVLASTVTSCYSNDLTKEECALYGDLYEYTQKEDGMTYNTYMMQGLPVGPVLCPGENAIYATLHPHDTDYFFFIGDGTNTYFARNIYEHQANIERYLR